MQQEIITTYLTLMDRLESLPDDIANQQEALTQAKQAQGDSERLMDEIEDSLRGKAAEESNDTKRKAKLAELCSQHEGYRRLSAAFQRERATVLELTDAVANLERQYEATCYQSRLHAGLMNYLGSAGAPVQFQFKANGHNGHIDAQDAAAIGL